MWGSNADGQLGQGLHQTKYFSPILIDVPSHTRVYAMALGRVLTGLIVGMECAVQSHYTGHCQLGGTTLRSVLVSKATIHSPDAGAAMSSLSTITHRLRHSHSHSHRHSHRHRHRRRRRRRRTDMQTDTDTHTDTGTLTATATEEEEEEEMQPIICTA